MNENGKVVKITSKRIFDSDWFPNDIKFEPIPLTDEWLVKFGFKIEIYTESIIATKLCNNNPDFSLLTMVGWKYFTFTTNVYNGNNEYCKDIIYVHQLQNLYFALTGEELTIKT